MVDFLGDVVGDEEKQQQQHLQPEDANHKTKRS